VKSAFFFPVIFLVFEGLMAQNPHGDKLKLDCKECHTTGTWLYEGDSVGFDHTMTGFVLEGSHQSVTCVDCHKSLSFEEVGSDCISCHQDVHSMSVGNDCSRCHSNTSWVVDNIPELHEQNGFPLNGQHQVI